MDVDPRTRLARALPGQRWVLRHRLPDGSATDTIGWIEESAGDRLTVSVAPAELRRLDPATIIAARRVSPAARGRDPRRTTAAELERIALPGWLAEQEPLGEWTLRFAGGFTGRANSCLAVGDPGLDYPAAAERIRRHAAAHGIEPRAQVILGSAEEQGLAELGWRPTYVATDVLAARLADLLGDTVPDPSVSVSEELSEAWLTGYRESRPNSLEPRLLRALLDGRPPRAFAAAGPADAPPFAIGRGHVNTDWLGLASIWTRADRRRSGWGRAIMNALGHWGARQGARSVYLQVAQQNTAAAESYRALGFGPHHSYGYLAPITRR